MDHLPIELKRIIYSFGYPAHRTYTKHICFIINKKKEILNYNIELVNSDIESFRMAGIEEIIELLIISIYDSKKHKLFNQCIKCYCCTKHCNKRPKNIFTDELTYTENYNTTCNCSCRSFARLMKNIYDDVENVKGHMNSTTYEYYSQRSNLNNWFIE